MFGSYEALTGGKARDAMVDMTGGVGESISLNQYESAESRQKLFEILHDAYENKALISASIMVSNGGGILRNKEIWRLSIFCLHAIRFGHLI